MFPTAHEKCVRIYLPRYTYRNRYIFIIIQKNIYQHNTQKKYNIKKKTPSVLGKSVKFYYYISCCIMCAPKIKTYPIYIYENGNGKT